MPAFALGIVQASLSLPASLKAIVRRHRAVATRPSRCNIAP
jgi:hypothetical protein